MLLLSLSAPLALSLRAPTLGAARAPLAAVSSRAALALGPAALVAAPWQASAVVETADASSAADAALPMLLLAEDGGIVGIISLGIIGLLLFFIGIRACHV